MGVQIALSRLQYYTTLKKLNKAMSELNSSMNRFPNYPSYISSHRNMLSAASL